MIVSDEQAKEIVKKNFSIDSAATRTNKKGLRLKQKNEKFALGRFSQIEYKYNRSFSTTSCFSLGDLYYMLWYICRRMIRMEA